MALSTFVGNFAQPTATNASFAVTGVGFTPKALILFATDESSIGVSANIADYRGMATSTSNRAAISNTQLSAGNTTCRAHDDTKCFLVVSAATGTTLVAADLVSFDSDGFTLNFSTVDIIARKIGYVAIGGADLTNVFIKEFIGAASNTDQSFTGVGFKPDAMILMSAGNGTAPPNSQTNSGCNPVFGFATASNQEVSATESSSATESLQLAKIVGKSSSGGSITMAATLKTFDSDGFTLNFTVSSSQKYCFALCLKGGQYKVGVFNQATGTGNQAAVTGAAFQPTGIILSSINRVTSTALYTDTSRISMGAASSSSARATIWNGGGNGGINDNDFDSGKIINMITEGASPTTNAAADFVSMDSGGFTINNTTADATAREITYMMMGSNAIVNTTLHTRTLLGVGL